MTSNPLARFRRISATDAADLIARYRRRVLPELALYDVRDRSWFDRGHIAGAEHLDDAGLGRALRRIPKRTPVIVYCYRGHASQVYAATFADFHFTEVYSVDGGFEPLAAALANCDRPSGEAMAGGELSDALHSLLDEFGFDHACLDLARAHGLTPLMRAALAGRHDLVDELLRLGVDFRLRNTDGNNALWLGCVSNEAKVVRRLLEAGIDVNNQNDSGATALMYAASSGKADLTALLLDSGADPDLRNQDDFRAVDLASSWACLKILRPPVRAPGDDAMRKNLDAR
ncbi:MAG: ankyrin repeat domain-containing protein [Vulcanimicrobiaceae bacterium]